MRDYDIFLDSVMSSFEQMDQTKNQFKLFKVDFKRFDQLKQRRKTNTQFFFFIKKQNKVCQKVRYQLISRQVQSFYLIFYTFILFIFLLALTNLVSTVQTKPILLQYFAKTKQKSFMPQAIGNNKYALGKVIASGSFGKVYSSFPYAIKQIKLPNANEAHQNFINHFKTTLQNQISILKDANHTHIVKLYEVIYQNDAVYLVMEYCQSDLKMKTINKAQGETKSIDIIGQILKGIKQMVKLGIVHRDLKPANILFHKGIYKIADFGMAKYLQTSENFMLKSHVGTPYYMAPQILQRKQYTAKCDVWSLGVIFYELIYGKLPWTGKDQKSLLSNILNHKVNFLPNVNISNQTKQVLSKMLCVSEHKRVSWQQLFVLFQILQKKSQPENKATFHRSIVETMLNIQKERISLIEYKCRFSQLTSEKIVQVFRILEGLIDPEYGYIVRDFFKKCN